MQKPSVGHIAHYRSYGTPGGEFPQTCRAAIITIVYAIDTVGLAVLNPTGLFFHEECEYHDPDTEGYPAGGTWHWPERVGE
jgi:hypothetical protein